jgi:cyclic pyranopterin phosphate synthase
MPKKLSHYDRSGRAKMVDVSAKNPTKREAEASAFVRLKPAVLAGLPNNPKGDPLEVARIAGIMAAKRTADLIPMCHSLPLSHVDVRMRLCENGVAIHARVASRDGSLSRCEHLRPHRVRYVQSSRQGN